jgi:menaquinone-dependent protoporphyrinogen IX oxidase
MAQNKEMAEKLKSILEESGILVRINPINRKEKVDDYFEVSVPEAEVEEAHGIIIEKGF